MAITKTGITVSTTGENDKTFEVDGQQSTVSASGLTPNKQYTVAAYIVDSNYGKIDAAQTTTFTTLASSTPVITDTGSGLSLSVARYEVRCSVSNTYALSNMEIKWASDAGMTTNVGTHNYALSGTSANVSYNITYRIPPSGQYIYVKLTATDIYGESETLTLSDRVPIDQLKVDTTYINSDTTYKFTQSVYPTPPPTALRTNYITYRIQGTGQAGWQYSSFEPSLNPVTVTFSPNTTYDVMGCVQDIYGLVSKTEIFQITVV